MLLFIGVPDEEEDEGVLARNPLEALLAQVVVSVSSEWSPGAEQWSAKALVDGDLGTCYGGARKSEEES